MIRYLKNFISNKIVQVSFAKQKKGKKKHIILEERKYVVSEKNPWLNPRDNFGKLEQGKV